MKYDFENSIDRSKTNSIKYHFFKKPGVIPMWVADMEYKAAPQIIEKLHQEVEQGIYGYVIPPSSLQELVKKRLYEKYQWEIETHWIEWLPGLVPGINLACRSIGKDGDRVATFTPIYPPFLKAPKQSRRKKVLIPLIKNDFTWEINFDAFEKECQAGLKLLLLCNPQNPTGKVFTKAELLKLVSICEKYQVAICSDEIHCDLILDEKCQHIPIANLKVYALQNSITLLAASKTFNLPGLNCSFAIIPNDELRLKFKQARDGIVPYVGNLGYVSTEAAYAFGENWHNELILFLRKQLSLVKETVEKLPQVSMIPPQATYLTWIDISKLDLHSPLDHFENHGLGLSDGRWFSQENYVRMNFATTTSQLTEALQRFIKACQ